LLGFNHIPTEESICVFQAFVYQLGDVASAFASFFIGIWVWTTIHQLHYSWLRLPGKKFEILTLLVVVGVPVLFIIIGWVKATITGIPFFGPTSLNAWCWISEAYPIERIMFEYAWMFLISFILFGLYIHIMKTLRETATESGAADAKEKKNLAMKMVGYPVVFFVAFIPLGIDRLIAYIAPSVIVPSSYLAFAICIFATNGFLNAAIYGYTRRIFHKAKASLYHSSKHGKITVSTATGGGTDGEFVSV